MKVERKIDMAASADDIYQVVMDPNRLKDWVSIHERLEDAPKSLRKGSTLTQSLKLAGRKFKVDWTVVENDRPTYVVWEGKGPLGSKAKAVYEFSESDGVTHFTYMQRVRPARRAAGEDGRAGGAQGHRKRTRRVTGEPALDRGVTICNTLLIC